MTTLRTITEITIQEGKPTPPVAQTLIDARMRLAEFENWHQGSLRGPDGAVCAIGAVQDVAGGKNIATEWSLLDEVGHHHIVYFNDHLSRTRRGHAAILRRFDRAIGLALERGI